MTLSTAMTNYLRRFARDERGNFAILIAFLLPVLVGIVGLASEAGVWFYQHQNMQSVADSSAYSAALAKTDYVVQANGVAALSGFVNGTNSVTVTVNQPPKAGTNISTAGAVEVIIAKPEARLFSALFGTAPVAISARAVAVNDYAGKGCVLALNGAASGAGTLQGNTTVNLKGCSFFDNSAHSTAALTVGGTASLKALSVRVAGGISGQTSITTDEGISTKVAPAADPYAGVTNPTATGSTTNNCCSHGTETLSPGIYKNGMKLVAGANITLQPGTYYLQGDLSVAGGSTLSGNNVTLVFTSNNSGSYATATVNGGATLNLTAPTTGDLAGIVAFGDRNMPVGSSFKFNGGATQNIQGAIYLPKADTAYAGGLDSPNTCMQLISDTVTFTGNSNFAIDCNGKGTKPIATSKVSVVE